MDFERRQQAAVKIFAEVLPVRPAQEIQEIALETAGKIGAAQGENLRFRHAPAGEFEEADARLFPEREILGPDPRAF
ncbi:MAG: hypothetical protein CVU58_01030 [Deltaproteobacteria bacterium HGW-Deltaproteobacteria-16]|nr:MAG: hypothetical protein CVU58_01030 [Deltaproteobacteria bacterium HGW-Deltaproteobacteria-16]